MEVQLINIKIRAKIERLTFGTIWIETAYFKMKSTLLLSKFRQTIPSSIKLLINNKEN